MNTIAILAVIAIVTVVGIIEATVIMTDIHAALAAQSQQGLCASSTARGGTFSVKNGTIASPGQCHFFTK
jgi:hypothetical protein